MKKLISVLLVLAMAFGLSTAAFASQQQELAFDNSAYFECQGYTLHYRTFEPEGQAKNSIMLLHGFGLSTAGLEPIALEYVGEGYRVVLVDLPNFGYSSRETSKTELVDREQLISELIAYLGGTWIIGGHSMGGGVAVNVAAMNPQSVTGLVLFAPAATTELNPALGILCSGGLVTRLFEIIISVASRLPFVMRMMVSMSFSDSEYAKSYDVSKISDPLKIKGTGRGMAIMASHARATDLEAFSALEIPTAIVWAQNDKVVSEQALKSFTDNAPEGTKVVTLTEGGHMAMEYSPALVCEQTLDVIELCK